MFPFHCCWWSCVVSSSSEISHPTTKWLIPPCITERCKPSVDASQTLLFLLLLLFIMLLGSSSIVGLELQFQKQTTLSTTTTIHHSQHHHVEKQSSYQTQFNFSIPVHSPPANLFTLVTFPNLSEKTKFDLVLEKTPYGTDSLTLEEKVFNNAQFAFAGQDNRGCHQSSGNYSIWRTETIDSHQTIEFLMKTMPNQLTGKVFSYGASADAISSYFLPRVKSPYLAGQCLVVGTANVHKFIYQNGAFRQQDLSVWLERLAHQPQSLPIIIEHEGMSEFWESNTLRSGENVTFPSLHIAGWNDLFLDGTLNAFKMYRQYRPHDTYLIIVPTGHCQKSEISYPEQELLLHPELLCPYLFKYSSLPFIDKITLYMMGPNSEPSSYANGNYYVTLPDFPETEPLRLYLTSSRTLSPHPFTSSPLTNLTFVYDPRNPTPTIGGNNLFVPTCGPYDQRTNENRPDNIIFTSEPFTRETMLVGSMKLSLRVSSNCTDTDFVVRLSDVYPEPDGRSMLLSDSIQRMRWRHGGSEKHLMTPNEIYELEIELWPTAYIFHERHRIRVAITSSNYPRFSVNPNNGLDLKHDPNIKSSSMIQNDDGKEIKEWPLITALNTLHLDGQTSFLTLPRVKDMNLIKQARHRFENIHKPKLLQALLLNHNLSRSGSSSNSSGSTSDHP
ncbi:hypothetical protein FDP41_003752 [Naegleria fowleri]|uniref:Xaa-Pro dipeptidyl-peptidase C-terminal domain-containing protein n=1 Tax=Naegleria fowleri TaxID=5763 RepID=A0A6A5BVZ2_NAEFO|nr:uncharacterized protein FDP41_003752 [Naegleria fowleri]KAF0977099.1 hypothetical protein FDP41_003752 [Naegleria fowleri]